MSKSKKVKEMGYDALQGNPRARAPINLFNRGRTEDALLDKWRRGDAGELIRDLARNHAAFNFAINKHVDSVTNIVFSAKTENPERNKELYRFYYRWRDNVDASGFGGWNQFISVMERCRLIDGDVLVIHVGNGKFRAIESRFITDPNIKDGHWVNGVLYSEQFEVIGFNVRMSVDDITSSVPIQRDVFINRQSSFLLRYAAYSDQTRGVSPLLCCVNQFVDVYEATSLALRKAKMSQVYGLITSRAGVSVEENKEIVLEDGYLHLDMGLQDRAEFITPATPPSEFVDFLEKTLRLAFSALDIPYEIFSGQDLPDLVLDFFLGSVARKQAELLRCLNWMLDVSLPDLSEEERYNVEFIGSTYPASYIIRNVDYIAKAKELGLMTDRNLTERFGISDEGDTKQETNTQKFINIGIGSGGNDGRT